MCSADNATKKKTSLIARCCAIVLVPMLLRIATLVHAMHNTYSDQSFYFCKWVRMRLCASKCVARFLSAYVCMCMYFVALIASYLIPCFCSTFIQSVVVLWRIRDNIRFEQSWLIKLRTIVFLACLEFGNTITCVDTQFKSSFSLSVRVIPLRLLWSAIFANFFIQTQND